MGLRKREGNHKADLPFFVLLQFRKLPEGFRKAYRKRTWELSFYVSPGRFPEGFPEADRKENNYPTSQKSKCQQSDSSQCGEDHSRCFCLWAVLENDLMQCISLNLGVAIVII